jgi:hypothetical protein
MKNSKSQIPTTRTAGTRKQYPIIKSSNAGMGFCFEIGKFKIVRDLDIGI